MSETITVRLDHDAARALAVLEAAGATRTEAVRQSLVEAARRLGDRTRLATEIETLLDDPADRHEAASVAEMMDELRAPW